jgi:quercetin 2,3-dioxygenase
MLFGIAKEVPMLTVRKAAERGHANFGWLDSHHSFSFGQYHDPKHMGFGPLRVINDDRVAAGMGFGEHGHDNMEIVSYVIEGALAHRDSLGSGSTLTQGFVQRMSAGTGIRHSEFNRSKTDPVHFLQIWILPEARGLTPSYEERHFSDAERRNTLRLVAAGTPTDGALKIHQDAAIYASVLETGKSLAHAIKPGRSAWLQVARGSLEANGQSLAEGDGLAVKDETKLTLTSTSDSEFLLFDLN